MGTEIAASLLATARDETLLRARGASTPRRQLVELRATDETVARQLLDLITSAHARPSWPPA